MTTDVSYSFAPDLQIAKKRLSEAPIQRTRIAFSTDLNWQDRNSILKRIKLLNAANDAFANIQQGRQQDDIGVVLKGGKPIYFLKHPIQYLRNLIHAGRVAKQQKLSLYGYPMHKSFPEPLSLDAKKAIAKALESDAVIQLMDEQWAQQLQAAKTDQEAFVLIQQAVAKARPDQHQAALEVLDNLLTHKKGILGVHVTIQQAIAADVFKFVPGFAEKWNTAKGTEEEKAILEEVQAIALHKAYDIDPFSEPLLANGLIRFIPDFEEAWNRAGTPEEKRQLIETTLGQLDDVHTSIQPVLADLLERYESPDTAHDNVPTFQKFQTEQEGRAIRQRAACRKSLSLGGVKRLNNTLKGLQSPTLSMKTVQKIKGHELTLTDFSKPTIFRQIDPQALADVLPLAGVPTAHVHEIVQVFGKLKALETTLREARTSTQTVLNTGTEAEQAEALKQLVKMEEVFTQAEKKALPLIRKLAADQVIVDTLTGVIAWQKTSAQNAVVATAEGKKITESTAKLFLDTLGVDGEQIDVDLLRQYLEKSDILNGLEKLSEKPSLFSSFSDAPSPLSKADRSDLIGVLEAITADDASIETVLTALSALQEKLNEWTKGIRKSGYISSIKSTKHGPQYTTSPEYQLVSEGSKIKSIHTGETVALLKLKAEINQLMSAIPVEVLESLLQAASD